MSKWATYSRRGRGANVVGAEDVTLLYENAGTFQGTSSVGTTARGFAWPFSLSGGARIAGVDVKSHRSLNGPGTCGLQLWSNAAGTPGVLLSSTPTLPGLSLPTTGAYVTWAFPFPHINGVTQYWLVAWASTLDASNYWIVSRGGAAGNTWTSVAGASWVGPVSLYLPQYRLRGVAD